MMMEIKELTRKFVIKETNTELPDIDPNMPVELIQQFYATQYPQLTTATFERAYDNDKWVYTFKSVIGTKG